MSLREIINRNPVIATVAVLLTAGVAVGAAIWSQQKPVERRTTPTQAFFTTDDGQTWFADDIKRVAPFEKGGKQAVKVHVFQCGNAKLFAGYLERCTPDAKRQIEAARGGPAPVGAVLTGTEFKKPGDARWTKLADLAAASNTRKVTCPEGEEAIEIRP